MQLVLKHGPEALHTSIRLGSQSLSCRWCLKQGTSRLCLHAAVSVASKMSITQQQVRRLPQLCTRLVRCFDSTESPRTLNLSVSSPLSPMGAP